MEIVKAILFTIIAIFLIGAVSHNSKDFDPRWIEAAAAVGLLVISTYIMFFLYEIEQRLKVLVRLFSDDDENLRLGLDKLLDRIKEQIAYLNTFKD